MSTAQELIARLRRNREFTVELEPAKSDSQPAVTVTCLRPTESDVARMTRQRDDNPDFVTTSVEDDDVARAAVGWSGISEATLFGAAVGSSDPIDFDQKLWAALAADHRDWYFKVAMKMLEAITEHNKKRAEDAKNSAAASMPSPE